MGFWLLAAVVAALAAIRLVQGVKQLVRAVKRFFAAHPIFIQE
jgi:Flp pilus assembly pilin Flp